MVAIIFWSRYIFWAMENGENCSFCVYFVQNPEEVICVAAHFFGRRGIPNAVVLCTLIWMVSSERSYDRWKSEVARGENFRTDLKPYCLVCMRTTGLKQPANIRTQGQKLDVIMPAPVRNNVRCISPIKTISNSKFGRVVRKEAYLSLASRSLAVWLSIIELVSGLSENLSQNVLNESRRTSAAIVLKDLNFGTFP